MSSIQRQTGFTIVELLIVIVVIGILAAITIVAYNGVQTKARTVAQLSALKQSAESATLNLMQTGAYPASSALPTSPGLNLTISGNTASATFCITATGNGYDTRNIDQDGITSTGPCDGHSGGASYCPESSVVAINGYYCSGNFGSAAPLQGSTIRLDAASAGVPTGAPGAFVGKQISRDSVGSNSITVSGGDTFCLSGWAATTDSTVNHTIGLSVTGPSLATQWKGVSYATASTTGWQKMSGCITIPAGYTAAKFWSQNNGDNASTAIPAWYQTALTLTKQ